MTAEPITPLIGYDIFPAPVADFVQGELQVSVADGIGRRREALALPLSTSLPRRRVNFTVGFPPCLFFGQYGGAGTVLINYFFEQLPIELLVNAEFSYRGQVIARIPLSYYYPTDQFLVTYFGQPGVNPIVSVPGFNNTGFSNTQSIPMLAPAGYVYGDPQPADGTIRVSIHDSSQNFQYAQPLNTRIGGEFPGSAAYDSTGGVFAGSFEVDGIFDKVDFVVSGIFFDTYWFNPASNGFHIGGAGSVQLLGFGTPTIHFNLFASVLSLQLDEEEEI